MVVENNLYRTENANYSWRAPGRGICAMGWMWLILEKKDNEFLIVDRRIRTETASNNRHDYACFDDEAETFDMIWEKSQNKKIEFSANDNNVRLAIQDIVGWVPGIGFGEWQQRPLSFTPPKRHNIGLWP